MKQGIKTAEFGQWLVDNVEEKSNRRFLVFYDHGDSRDPHVVAPKAFWDKDENGKVKNLNRLADVDVLIVTNPEKTEKKEVVFVIEIEERPVTPKKLLGDILAVCMANRFAIKKGKSQSYFSISGATQFIIAGSLPGKGKRLEKIEKTVIPRLKQMPALPTGINPEKIKIIFKEDLTKSIDCLCNLILEYPGI